MVSVIIATPQKKNTDRLEPNQYPQMSCVYVGREELSFNLKQVGKHNPAASTSVGLEKSVNVII